MSVTAGLILAAAAAQATPAAAPGSGAQVERARVSVTITRAAVLQHGALVRGHDDRAPRSQRQSSDGRVTYEFE